MTIIQTSPLDLGRNVMKIVISEQPVEIHAMRHMREYIQIMQQRGTTVNYSANTRSGFLFSTSVYNEKKKWNKIEARAHLAST